MGIKINNIKTGEVIPRNIVMSIVDTLQKDGYYVKTHLLKRSHTCRISGKYGIYTPHIFAFKGANDIRAIEFETCASISSHENENKWKVLSSKPGLDFHIIVPLNCMERAQFKSRIKNIPVKIHCIDKWKNIFDNEPAK